jgi:AmiR/NasT family two-component response regulator
VPRRPAEAVPAESLSERQLEAALADAHRQIATLRAGLQRRTTIGQAIGITMIQAGVTVDSAFADLIHRSQNANVKVRDLAEQIVQEAEAHATTARRA